MVEVLLIGLLACLVLAMILLYRCSTKKTPDEIEVKRSEEAYQIKDAWEKFERLVSATDLTVSLRTSTSFIRLTGTLRSKPYLNVYHSNSERKDY